jgi:HlyD family secretion protein
MNVLSSKIVGQPLDPSSETDSPSGEFRTGALIGGLFFVGLLGWAALTPLHAGAYAEGVVVVSGNRQVVQHREGGIITHLFVTEGQVVKKGDPLAIVSTSELVAAERGATGEVISLLAMRERLMTEQNGGSAVHEPAEFAAYTGEDKALAEAAMQGQRNVFRARRTSLFTERGVLSQRMAQHRQQINGFQHQIRANLEQQRLISDEVAGLADLVPKGFVSLNRLRATERVASELRGNYGSHTADVARSHEAIGESRMQMVSLDRQLITEAASQLREVQVRLDELKPKLLSLREQVARSVVRAPAGGRVVGLSVFTVGGVVAPGDKLMEVVPQDRDLVIDGKVAPNDADDVRPGMVTQVKFPALQERNMPILTGKVTKISADTLEDERSGIRYFKVEVRVPPEQMRLIRQVRPGGGLMAGLPAEVVIPLRKRTALQYLVEPLTQSLWKAGREN